MMTWIYIGLAGVITALCILLGGMFLPPIIGDMIGKACRE